MPVYNDTDDSDVWRDDESMTSTDDFSSQTGDLESMEDSDDYEFLSRSSSHAHTEEEGEETDIDEVASGLTTDPTAGSNNGFGSESTAVSRITPATAEEQANVLLQSTELPRVISDARSLEDSTATVTGTSRQRRDTITPATPTVDQPISSGKPFNILYAGSDTLKNDVLRKIGQALMAVTLRDRSLDQSIPSHSSSGSFGSDWSNGCTNVVPITDFNSSDTVPEVEFVEDSSVKMRVKGIDTLQGFAGRRASHFLCQVNQNTRAISCQHYGRNHFNCPWLEDTDTCQSLMVYCSPVRGEKSNVNLQKVESFAEIHHIPLLIISDWERSSKLFSFSWNDGNIPIPESEGRTVMLGYEPITPKKFFSLESAALGLSLWRNAAISQDAVKSSQKVFILFKVTNSKTSFFNMEKRYKFRVAAGVLFALLLLFFPLLPARSSVKVDRPSRANLLSKTFPVKDLGTKYTGSADLLSPLPSTVTVTEQMTVTVPIVHTKTVTTSTTITPKSQKAPFKAASTILLHPITSSINVPRASLMPRFPNVDYGYAFGYNDEIIQLYLETENSLVLRLPAVYRDATSPRPKVKVSVTRDNTLVHVDLREWKKNDLAFISWSPEDSHGRLVVKVWTESAPVMKEEIIVDYKEPIIDPRLWEILSHSQQAAWKSLHRMSGNMERQMRLLADDVTSNVVSSAQGKVAEYLRKVKQMQDEMREVAERNLKELKANKYPLLKDQAQKRMGDTLQRMEVTLLKAQGEAVRLTQGIKHHFREREQRRGDWKRVKEYWKQRSHKGSCGKKTQSTECKANGRKVRTNGKKVAGWR
jgi:hypothetical protein